MKNIDQIRDHVLNAYLNTGSHVFVADIAKQFNTNALGVRNALGYDDFVFEAADRWQGSSMCGRYVLAPCVEPTKTYLAKIIKSIQGAK
jgi:hypothetical protein